MVRAGPSPRSDLITTFSQQFLCISKAFKARRLRVMKPRLESRSGRAHRLRIGRHSERNRTYHIVTSTLDRTRFFANLFAGRIVTNAMRREDEAGHVNTLAFVVMPDHLHWLFTLSGSRSLSKAVGTMKSYSTRRLNEHLVRSGQVWRSGFYDHAIRNDEVLVHVARYIIANPLRAGIVRSVRQYSLWDSVWVK